MADSDWPTSAQRELVEYAQAYIAEFNMLRGRLEQAGSPAALYARELGTACVFSARDGVAILYVCENHRPEAGLDKGVLLQDLEDETIAHFIQSSTANLLKISPWKSGDDIRGEMEMPPDVPGRDLKGGISPDVLEPHLGKPGGVNLTGLLVGPQWNVDGGILKTMVPTRAHVLSPVACVPPDQRCVLQFLFPFIDLIWLQEDLRLDGDAGQLFARADIEVMLLGLAAHIPQHQLAEDPFEAVAQHCERVCDRLVTLIDDPLTIESQVQEFLEVSAHQFLVAPHSLNILPRKPLGGNRFIPDFTVQRADGDYHFIEIESPNSVIYQAKGEEPTSAFTHAIQQVEDWLRYVDENILTVRNEDCLPAIRKPSGEVVIGRDQQLGITAKTRFLFKRGESGRLSLKTWDMVIAEGRAYANSLRRMKGAIPTK